MALCCRRCRWTIVTWNFVLTYGSSSLSLCLHWLHVNCYDVDTDDNITPWHDMDLTLKRWHRVKKNNAIISMPKSAYVHKQWSDNRREPDTTKILVKVSDTTMANSKDTTRNLWWCQLHANAATSTRPGMKKRSSGTINARRSACDVASKQSGSHNQKWLGRVN